MRAWKTLSVAAMFVPHLIAHAGGADALLVEAASDPRRERAYVKVEGEAARIITRASKEHPAFDPVDLRGPSLHYEVFGARLPDGVSMPKAASGGKALFNTGSGEQTPEEAARNAVYLPHQEPPLGTIAAYRFRFREAGVYELFLRLAYWRESHRPDRNGASTAAHTTATGVGAIHVNDYEKGRPLNSSWWRRHNNAAWDLSDREWKVIDFGPALEVKESDLNDQGYVDVIWQISASHPGLIIDSLVLYQGYHIDPSESKYAQEKAFAALPMTPGKRLP